MPIAAGSGISPQPLTCWQNCCSDNHTIGQSARILHDDVIFFLSSYVFVAPVSRSGFHYEGGKANNRKQSKADNQHASPFSSVSAVFYSTADACRSQIRGNPYARLALASADPGSVRAHSASARVAPGYCFETTTVETIAFPRRCGRLGIRLSPL
ncbi:protein of unknown function (plasmid) [Cupriavidus taiwanensis]|uniref:Uncharacterized protein n=1 Tax=Cupriavidus taiwanensis TaxID=164546 RepID=A0A9Q7UXR8_9BURK|nr:protein of unknown function [Cupriavidus taiwanensis]